MVEYPKAVTKIEIGQSISSNADLTAIEYAGDRLIGSGPGGDLVSPLTVPNTRQPVGVVQHHDYWEIVVGLSEDELAALYNTNVGSGGRAAGVSADNAPIGYFAMTQASTDNHTRTITYETGKTYLAGIGANKITNEDGKYVVEAKFICIGTRAVTAWA